MLALVLTAYLLSQTPEYPLYITAAHLPHDVMTESGYTYVGELPEYDMAFYLDRDTTWEIPKKDSKVSFVDYSGTVTSTGSGPEFHVKMDNGRPYEGMSGARVRDSSGRVVGFVSSTRGDELICMSVVCKR